MENWKTNLGISKEGRINTECTRKERKKQKKKIKTGKAGNKT
jgi:hypothetical protein